MDKTRNINNKKTQHSFGLYTYTYIHLSTIIDFAVLLSMVALFVSLVLAHWAQIKDKDGTVAKLDFFKDIFRIFEQM